MLVDEQKVLGVIDALGMDFVLGSVVAGVVDAAGAESEDVREACLARTRMYMSKVRPAVDRTEPERIDVSRLADSGAPNRRGRKPKKKAAAKKKVRARVGRPPKDRAMSTEDGGGQEQGGGTSTKTCLMCQSRKGMTAFKRGSTICRKCTQGIEGTTGGSL